MNENDPDLPAFAAFGPISELKTPTLGIANPQAIHIGSWVTIGTFAVIEALRPDRGINVRIGDGTYVGHFLRLTAVNRVEIGADVLIADRVYISDTGHIYDDVTRPINAQGLMDNGNTVEIADGAWIGIGAAIVGGVRIGRNAVVGANAVVRDDVPDFSVAIGNPARIVRQHDGDQWRWMVPRDQM